MSPWRQAVPRLLALCTMALWWGGLTFYALVVVPVGTAVLGGHRQQGFVTREVAPWLNALGALAALCSLPQVLRHGTRVGRVAWLLMAVSQAGLLGIYPWADSYLDPRTHAIVEAGAFYAVHRAYLLVSALQWLACSVCAGSLLAAWHREALNRPAPAGPTSGSAGS